MVLKARRSYFYFLSFAKKKGVSCAPRRSSVFARVGKVQKPLLSRPDWDNTIHDLSAWKLTPKQLEARRTAFRTLPEHRVRRSISSATPTLSCNGEGDANRAEQWTNGHKGTSAAKPATAAAAADALKPLPYPNLLKKRNRVGKENKKSALVQAPKLHLARKTHKSTDSSTKILTPFERAAHATIRYPQASNQTTEQETESGRNQTLRSTPTVDFEDEVKQFEARTRKFLVQGLKSSSVQSTKCVAGRRRSDKRIVIERKACPNSAKKLRTLKLLLSRARMDKSDSSDDDSSVSGPWGSSISGFKTVMHSTPQHHHHRKRYNRKSQEGAPDIKAGRLSSKSNYWDLQPQNELVNYEQPVEAASKPRVKLQNRHLGSIQKTSLIGDWRENVEDGANGHLSLPQEFQQHMLKCQHDLTQEFKEFKISISKQIMNLQLDIDTVLEFQKRKDSHKAETRAQSSYRTGADSPAHEGVGDNVELPTYSSLKVRKDVIKPASPSSGESSHMPLFSCYESQYTASRKSSAQTRSIHGSENGSRRPSCAAEAPGPEPHIFNNPIYHVQTSSDKRGEISDSDTSVSSVELAKFFTGRNGHQHQHLKTESHSNGDGYRMRSDEPSLANHGTKSPSNLRMLGIEEKKTYSLVPYGSAQNQAEATAIRLPEGDISENSYGENRIESNGHAQSSTVRAGGSNEQSLRQNNARCQHNDALRPVNKMVNIPPFPGIATYRMQQPLATEEDSTVHHDLELRLGNSGITSGRASPNDYRNRLSPTISRPLSTTGNWENVPSSSIIALSVTDGHQMPKRERSDSAQERPHSRNAKVIKNADEREVFTLRGWSAAFLHLTDNSQQGTQAAPSTVTETVTPTRATTPDPPKKESQPETTNGIMRFQGRSSRGGVAWTVSEPPGSAKKLRNAAA
ncbi:hypothetical protein MPTK1_3g11820 [Marchantia polymorpha subsp. ruderalis]|uniref:Uncharacterized protein n=2 Tax=Marchantia polymorpha TaxID=3197 RepID=A0AAF6AZU3_MARPO|nr:hypothetical protein MARPO_0037s0015 [Marchantia polymorpha]BBN05277.1 hypothetical protein Mp_3g11820 [Marchantia polymorpha subsp. ruderalis]|eukprot:PTQ40827.1 hypothetical protein MARPO_0037s0015 [Marchantia polymorpha]